MSRPAAERSVLLVLGVISAARVFAFSAALPFFGGVDEAQHFDVAVRYAHADPPRAVEAPSAEAVPYLVVFSTPEYLLSPTMVEGGRIDPPPWKQPQEAVGGMLAAGERYWTNEVRNIEASQPPLYYALLGAWWRTLRALGCDGLPLLYALRFLNVVFVVATVGLGWLAACEAAPGNAFVRLAVPALIAFMPQSIFYAINNDVLSPVAFGASFVLLMKLWNAEAPSLRLAAATGLSLAATFLTKIANVPLLAVAVAMIALKLLRMRRGGRLRAAIAPTALLGLCAGVPILAWMAWCRTHFGDLTGSIVKIRSLGWTAKPLSEWLHHPIFTPAGAWIFVRGNLATLWQGELAWHGRPLSVPAADLIYTVSTLACVGLALAARRRPTPIDGGERSALGFGIACVVAAFLFFALLSVGYDFHDCPNPSREKPFFTSGRLMLGMLVPFMILVATGLDRALERLGKRGAYLALALILMAMLATEIGIDSRFFPNAYNWYQR